MNINKDLISYLNGEKFSDGYVLKISEQKELFTRLEYIEQLVKNKKVIHFGCCDHIPLIQEKINNNQWLHKIITESSSETLGIDINKRGIDYLTNDLGYQNVACADILKDTVDEINLQKWDYIVLGEILEHVDNPVHFLNEIRTKYSSQIEKIIITVPNIMSSFYGFKMLDNKELINSDHRYWFTPYTLLKVMSQAGIEPIKLDFVDYKPYIKFNLKERILKKIKRKINPYNITYPLHSFVTLVGTGRLK